jgi:hypothetical protein
MAVIYYSANQRARAIQYYVTVSAAASTNTITATVNSKTETYTVTATDTATTAATNAVLQFSQTLLNELRVFTFSNPADGIIAAVGPSSGSPVSITWGGTATLTGTTATVTALSPADIDDATNYAGGVKPGNGDTLILENGSFDLLWNLNEFTSNTVTLIRRASHTGRVGLDDYNPAGYVEYLPRFFETAGTTITLEDNGQGGARIRSTAGSAVTVTITGTGTGNLGSETFELYGTPASSVANINGGGLAFCPLGSQTGTLTTVRCANGSFRSGSGATLVTFTAQNSNVAIAGAFTTYTQDNGSSSTFSRASAGTTVNINDGSVAWGSTGAITTLNVYSGGTFDCTTAPALFAITTVNTYEGSTSIDTNKRITRSFTWNWNGDLTKQSVDWGTDGGTTVSS